MRWWIIVLVLTSGCARSTLHQVPVGATVELPQDHAPHEWAQTEWWHVHADVVDVATGEPLSVFAGFIMERTDLDRAAFIPIRLAINPYHAAYCQLFEDGRARAAGRYNFPLRFAARFVGDGLDLRMHKWRIAFDQGVVILKTRVGRDQIELRLTPTRPATLPGAGGRITLVPDTLHMWMQWENMEVTGSIRRGKEVRWLEGIGFFKHQWGRLYHADVQGFEWFSFDLPDGRAMVIAWIGMNDVRGVVGSQAWISSGGTPQPLAIEDLSVTVLKEWRSPATGATWPTHWRIEGAGLELTVSALTNDQEILIFPAPFYVGPARAVGTFNGAPADWPAFIEHVGAFAPIVRPLYKSQSPPETP